MQPNIETPTLTTYTSWPLVPVRAPLSLSWAGQPFDPSGRCIITHCAKSSPRESNSVCSLWLCCLFLPGCSILQSFVRPMSKSTSKVSNKSVLGNGYPQYVCVFRDWQSRILHQLKLRLKSWFYSFPTIGNS